MAIFHCWFLVPHSEVLLMQRSLDCVSNHDRVFAVTDIGLTGNGRVAEREFVCLLKYCSQIPLVNSAIWNFGEKLFSFSFNLDFFSDQRVQFSLDHLVEEPMLNSQGHLKLSQLLCLVQICLDNTHWTILISWSNDAQNLQLWTQS